MITARTRYTAAVKSGATAAEWTAIALDLEREAGAGDLVVAMYEDLEEKSTAARARRLARKLRAHATDARARAQAA